MFGIVLKLWMTSRMSGYCRIGRMMLWIHIFFVKLIDFDSTTWKLTVGPWLGHWLFPFRFEGLESGFPSSVSQIDDCLFWTNNDDDAHQRLMIGLTCALQIFTINILPRHLRDSSLWMRQNRHEKAWLCLVDLATQEPYITTAQLHI